MWDPRSARVSQDSVNSRRGAAASQERGPALLGEALGCGGLSRPRVAGRSVAVPPASDTRRPHISITGGLLSLAQASKAGAEEERGRDGAARLGSQTGVRRRGKEHHLARESFL